MLAMPDIVKLHAATFIYMLFSYAIESLCLIYIVQYNIQVHYNVVILVYTINKVTSN